MRPFLLLLILFTSVLAQQPKQQMDEDFAKSIKEWTTKPEFISPLIDHLPKVEGFLRRKMCSAITSGLRRN